MKVTIEEGVVYWDEGNGDCLSDYVFIALKMNAEFEWITDGCYWMVLK